MENLTLTFDNFIEIDDKWHHLAVSFDGSLFPSIYVDGKEAYIDSYALYDTALSAEKIKEHAAKAAKG